MSDSNLQQPSLEATDQSVPLHHSSSSDSELYHCYMIQNPPMQNESYLPLGNGGKATDFNFLSSAAVKQFFTVSSSCSSHLSEPHCGMWQWMTNFAARPLDWVSAANTNENTTFSFEWKPPCNDLSIQHTFLITSLLQRNTLGIKICHNGSLVIIIWLSHHYFFDHLLFFWKRKNTGFIWLTHS